MHLDAILVVLECYENGFQMHLDASRRDCMEEFYQSGAATHGRLYVISRRQKTSLSVLQRFLE